MYLWWYIGSNSIEPYYEGFRDSLPEFIAIVFNVFFEILHDPVHFAMFVLFTGLGTGIAFSIKENGERMLNVEEKGVDIVFLSIVVMGLAPAAKLGEFLAPFNGNTIRDHKFF